MGVEWGADSDQLLTYSMHEHMGCIGSPVVVEWVKVVDEVL